MSANNSLIHQPEQEVIQPQEVINASYTSDHSQTTQPVNPIPGQPVIHHLTQIHNTAPTIAERPHLTIPQKIEHILIFMYTVLAIFLGTRFVFSLVNINLDTPIVGLVYQVTQPFVNPFAGLFSNIFPSGIFHIEYEVVAAMGVYALIFIGIAKMITIIFG